MLPPLHYYPVFTAVLFPFTFLLTYAIAVALNHTEVDWPYISDTSAHPPESCIFSQLVNIGALFVGMVVYIRYKQVHEFYVSHQINLRSNRINFLGLWLGWLGALGLSIVANFQEYAVFKVHLTGAIMAFGVGTAYMWTQVYASYQLCSLTHGECLKYLRLSLTVINTLGFILMLVTGELAHSYFHGKDPGKWYPTDGGWELHVTSTVTEWIIAAGFNIFLLSFVKEFKQVTLDSPRICLRINRMDLLFEEGQNTFEASYAESITSATEEDLMQPARTVRA